MSKVVEASELRYRRFDRKYAAEEKAELRQRIDDAIRRVTAAGERQRLEAESLQMTSSTIWSFKE